MTQCQNPFCKRAFAQIGLFRKRAIQKYMCAKALLQKSFLTLWSQWYRGLFSTKGSCAKEPSCHEYHDCYFDMALIQKCPRHKGTTAMVKIAIEAINEVAKCKRVPEILQCI